MKKIYTILLGLSFLFSSCVVDDNLNYHHTGEQLLRICNYIVERSITTPMTQIVCSRSLPEASYYGFIAIEDAETGSWTIKNTNDDVRFEYVATPEDVNNKIDPWFCEEFTAVYNEKFSEYSARLTNIGKMKFEWQLDFLNPVYGISFSAPMKLELYKDGILVETKEINYSIDNSIIFPKYE